VPKKPPGPWFEEMSAKIRSGNPDYSDEQIRKTVGDIWYNKMSPSKKKEETKKSEGSLKKQATNVSVVQGFADALFKSAWASYEEEKGTSFSGVEILDVAPDTPSEVIDFAEKEIAEIEEANSMNFNLFIPPGEQDGSYSDWDLGWYIGMEYLGHGVGWSDDHEDLGLEIPSGEFGILGENDDGTYDFYPSLSATKQEESEECTCGGPGKGFSMGRKDFVTCKDCGKSKSPDWKGDFERTGDHNMKPKAFGETNIDPKETPKEKTFKIKFSSAVWDVLFERQEGQQGGKSESDILLGLLARTANELATEATFDELRLAREELDAALLDEIDPVIGDEITTTIMTIDDLLVGNAAEGAIGELDVFFPSAKKRTTKRAVGFPNMLSNDTRKWIQLQTTNLAAKKGVPATPEQAHAYIDDASIAVAQELANAIGPEVKKVVDEFRDKIFQDITAGVELAAPNAKPASPIVPPAPVSEEAAPVQPPGASFKRAKMSQDLKRAFDNSYAYDALALVLDAELGHDFTKKITADEVIDEEEALLDIAQQDFPNASRKDLANAFGEILTDAYTRAG
jgi:hypothetical protein